MNGDGKLTPADRDRVANILLGMSQLYELKFNKLFNTFSDCVKTGEFKSV
jgi:hypothetical protein